MKKLIYILCILFMSIPISFADDVENHVFTVNNTTDTVTFYPLPKTSLHKIWEPTSMGFVLLNSTNPIGFFYYYKPTMLIYLGDSKVSLDFMYENNLLYYNSDPSFVLNRIY